MLRAREGWQDSEIAWPPGIPIADERRSLAEQLISDIEAAASYSRKPWIEDPLMFPVELPGPELPLVHARVLTPVFA